MNTKPTLLLIIALTAPAAAQEVGDPALLARQQRSAAVAAGLVRQEPLYQENVLAGNRLREEREAQAASRAAQRALMESTAAVERAEYRLQEVERRADWNLRTLHAEMAVRQTMAVEAMARRRR